MTTIDRLAVDRDDKIDLVALWQVMWGHKYLIVLTTVLGGLIAVFMALTAIHIFRAETTITEVNQDRGLAASLANQLGGLASLVGVNLSNSGNSGREAKALLKSRRLVEEFVTRYELLPILFPKAAETATMWRAVRQFREGVLSIREDARNGVTVVAVNWTDPAVAARWANDFVALANEMLRTRAMEDSKASIEYLNEQIAGTNIVELQRVMYNLIENETQTLMLANARPEYAFAVVDPAVTPEIRVSPRRTLMVLFGLAIGFIVGTAAAFAHSLYAETMGSRRPS